MFILAPSGLFFEKEPLSNFGFFVSVISFRLLCVLKSCATLIAFGNFFAEGLNDFPSDSTMVRLAFIL